MHYRAQHNQMRSLEGLTQYIKFRMSDLHDTSVPSFTFTSIGLRIIWFMDRSTDAKILLHLERLPEADGDEQ